MKSQGLKNELAQGLILLAPLCVIALLWDKIPGTVPIHWNAEGKVDGYASKAFGTVFVPMVNMGMAGLLAVVPKLDPRFKTTNADIGASVSRTLKVIRLIITSFLSAVSIFMTLSAVGWWKGEMSSSYFIHVGVAILFILLGNLMPKMRQNYLVGIRTPWTLKSKEVWTRTHRAGGRLMVVAGCLMIFFCLFLTLEQYLYWVVIPLAVVLLGFSYIYSYLPYKKETAS